MKQFILGPIQTKWVESLEQHPERQRRYSLGKKHPDGSYTACCLGEGGLIAGVCNWNGDILEVKNEFIGNEPDFNKAGELLGRAYEALGLRNPVGVGSLYTLAELNDSGTSWPEIATILRKHPEIYFTKSV